RHHQPRRHRLGRISMFEHRRQKVITTRLFIKRWLKFAGLGLLLILAALSIGILGYHYFAHMDWLDALLNASMILGGMGPVDTLTTDPSKVFASVYALFSGLVFIAVMGIMLTPVMHRVLHKFHVDKE